MDVDDLTVHGVEFVEYHMDAIIWTLTQAIRHFSHETQSDTDPRPQLWAPAKALQQLDYRVKTKTESAVHCNFHMMGIYR
jgi:hypothetical protein